MKVLTKLFYIFLPLIFIVLGLYLSLSDIHLTGGTDKIFHFASFFALSIVFAISFSKLIVNDSWFKYYFITICIVFAAIGAIIELIQQYYTLTREMDLCDWLANLTGIALATVIIFLVKSYKDKKKEKDEY